VRIDAKDVPGDVVAICRELAKHGYKGWVVGGCLRDLLRGHPAADWDVATDAHPGAVQKIFPRVIPTGIQHGTVTVRQGRSSYEVTTLRGEGSYSDGRRPDRVDFVSDIEADLARRDFTINAMAYDPLSGVITDPFAGEQDLNARLIRAVGDARERFSEDGLRVLRAARFAATLDFEIEPATEAAIRPTLDTFRKVSAERVRDEWIKAFKAERPSRTFSIMERTGIAEITCPFLHELDETRLVWAHAALDACPRDSCLRVAALLACASDDLAMMGDWLVRYRFSNDEQERILGVVKHVREPWGQIESDGALRRFAARVGRGMLDSVLEVSLRMAETHPDAANMAARVREFAARLRAALAANAPLTAKELAIGGRDLIGELGLRPGPQLGVLIEALLERALDNPGLNTREQLLSLAKDLAAGAAT
jgi:tRNA nucleotidyltransferase (CCA-adding enzyme)